MPRLAWHAVGLGCYRGALSQGGVAEMVSLHTLVSQHIDNVYTWLDLFQYLFPLGQCFILI